MDGQMKELKLRVLREKKKFNIMRLKTSARIDLSSLNEPTLVRKQVERVNHEVTVPLYGEGSQYGIEQKNEARRLKRGIFRREPKPDDQPLMLKESGKKGKSFVGKREGGVNVNSSYFILSRASDSVFEAFPVNAWYDFTPMITYKTLDADEAEEQFGSRNKMYNYFAVMAQKKMQNEETSDKAETTVIPDRLQVKDDDWLNVSSDDETDTTGKPKSKTVRAKKSDDDTTEDPREDPDEFQSLEVDYISDSESEEEERERVTKGSPKKDEEKDSSEDDRPEDAQDKRSEDEESENEEEKESDDDLTETGKATKALLKRREDLSGSDNEGSDVDEDFDADLQDVGTALLQRKPMTQETQSVKTETKETKEKTNDTPPTPPKQKPPKPSKGKKRPNEPDPSTETAAPPSKKERTNTHSPSSLSEGVTAEDVRRYLGHKPMTTKQLLKKFKRKTNMDGHDLVVQLGKVLKKVNPHQEKVQGKVFLSLRK